MTVAYFHQLWIGDHQLFHSLLYPSTYTPYFFSFFTRHTHFFSHITLPCLPLTAPISSELSRKFIPKQWAKQFPRSHLFTFLPSHQNHTITPPRAQSSPSYCKPEWRVWQPSVRSWSPRLPLPLLHLPIRRIIAGSMLCAVCLSHPLNFPAIRFVLRPFRFGVESIIVRRLPGSFLLKRFLIPRILKPVLILMLAGWGFPFCFTLFPVGFDCYCFFLISFRWNLSWNGLHCCN